MPAEHASLPRPGLTRKSWALIILLSFFGQVAWALENNFFNLFIQDVFDASLSDVALMVSASALTAAATTRFVGAWSDRAGKRKAFIGIGTVLWGLSIIVFAYLQTISLALAGSKPGLRFANPVNPFGSSCAVMLLSSSLDRRSFSRTSINL